MVAYALPKNIEGLKTDLEKYRITYDVWFRRAPSHESGAIDDIVKTLSERALPMKRMAPFGIKPRPMAGRRTRS